MRPDIEKLDYVGFTFNGIHSSQFGLKAVSSSNRYTRSLLPATADSTAEVNGIDGTYFFGSSFKNNTFNFSLAFDTVTEQELREMSHWLHNNGTVAPLIFDELPYIQYYARVTGNTTFKFIAFEDATYARVYKGEASVTFTAYDPYGYIVHKFLSEYNDENIGEWSEASQLLFSKKVNNIDYYDTYDTGVIPLYNPGDVEVDSILTLIVNRGTGLAPIDQISVTLDGNNNYILNTLNITHGTTITVDTKKRLIKNGTAVVNYILIDGDLFKIPVSSKTMALTITGVSNASIEYPYKYL